ACISKDAFVVVSKCCTYSREYDASRGEWFRPHLFQDNVVNVVEGLVEILCIAVRVEVSDLYVQPFSYRLTLVARVEGVALLHHCNLAERIFVKVVSCSLPSSAVYALGRGFERHFFFPRPLPSNARSVRSNRAISSESAASRAASRRAASKL